MLRSAADAISDSTIAVYALLDNTSLTMISDNIVTSYWVSENNTSATADAVADKPLTTDVPDNMFRSAVDVISDSTMTVDMIPDNIVTVHEVPDINTPATADAVSDSPLTTDVPDNMLRSAPDEISDSTIAVYALLDNTSLTVDMIPDNIVTSHWVPENNTSATADAVADNPLTTDVPDHMLRSAADDISDSTIAVYALLDNTSLTIDMIPDNFITSHWVPEMNTSATVHAVPDNPLTIDVPANMPSVTNDACKSKSILDCAAKLGQ
jgi:hypothetical protein